MIDSTELFRRYDAKFGPQESWLQPGETRLWGSVWHGGRLWRIHEEVETGNLWAKPAEHFRQARLYSVGETGGQNLVASILIPIEPNGPVPIAIVRGDKVYIRQGECSDDVGLPRYVESTAHFVQS